MTTLLGLLAAWALAAAFAVALGKTAAIGDAQGVEQLMRGEASHPDRSSAPPNGGPRAARGAAGRRGGDALRWEVEAARQALVEAEARLAAFQASHDADAT